MLLQGNTDASRGSRIKTLRLWLRSFAGGETCAACGRHETGGESLLCPSCLPLILEKTEEACPLCGLRAADCVCVPSEMAEAGADALLKLGYYDASEGSHPFNRCILRLKDNRDVMLAQWLTEPLMPRLFALLAEYGVRDSECTVTFVPRSAAKQRQTGTDQARLIARVAASESGIGFLRTIYRTKKKTGSQKALGASGRASNVRGMFEVRDVGTVFAKTVILTDDLVTTGATMAECCRVLKAAGARRVICLCIGRTSIR